MDCSTLGFPVLHCLPELAQTHVHWISGAIKTSHPLLPASPPAFNLAQHRGLYRWFGLLHQVAKELALQLRYQSFQWVLRVDFLYDWLVWSPCCPRDSQEFTPAPQFKSINSSGLSLLYGPTLTSVHEYWKNHSFDCRALCLCFLLHCLGMSCVCLPNYREPSAAIHGVAESQIRLSDWTTATLICSFVYIGCYWRGGGLTGLALPVAKKDPSLQGNTSWPLFERSCASSLCMTD